MLTATAWLPEQPLMSEMIGRNTAKAITAKTPLPLFAGDLDGEGISEAPVTLPTMSLGEEVVEDYVALRLTLRAHPMALLRPRLTPAVAPPR